MRTGPADDVELARRAVGGDGPAFAELFDRWFDRAFDVAWHVVRNRNTAAEVAQESFATAWQQIATLRQPASFGGWILRIARNKALNRLAVEQRARPVGDESALADVDLGRGGRTAHTNDAAEPVMDRERDDLVWAASAALGDGDASLLSLHLRHGLDAPELADELGIAANAAHQRLFRLKKRLGDAIGAWILWQLGGPRCDALRSLLADAGTTRFDRAAAAMISAHSRGCPDCTDRRTLALDPEVMFGAVPLVAAGPALKAQAAAALATTGVPTASAAAGGGASAGGAAPSPGGAPTTPAPASAPGPGAGPPADPSAGPPTQPTTGTTTDPGTGTSTPTDPGTGPDPGTNPATGHPTSPDPATSTSTPTDSGTSTGAGPDPGTNPAAGHPTGPEPATSAATEPATGTPGEHAAATEPGMTSGSDPASGPTGEPGAMSEAAQSAGSVAGGTGRRAAVMAAAVVVAVLVGVAVVLATRGDEDPGVVAASADTSTNAPSTSAEPTSTAPTTAPPPTTTASGSTTGATATPVTDPAPVVTSPTTTTPPPPPEPEEPDPPVIGGFRAEPLATGNCADPNETVTTFSWTSSGATGADLGPVGGAATPVDPSGAHTACAASGSAWALTVTGPGGTATANATIP